MECARDATHSAHWWNAPIFFPLQGALAMSATLVGLAPLTSPLQWIGVSPIAVYNVCHILSFPTAAFAADALARRLTGRSDAALIAGLAFGFSPYRIAETGHIQMLVSAWMPLGLLALHRFLDTHRARDLALLAVCWIANALTSADYLFFFAVFVVMWTLWFIRTRRDWLAVGATLAAATAAIAPVVIMFARRHAALGLPASVGDAEGFGADVTAFWAASSREWLAHYWTFTPRPEGELYLGGTIAGLSVIGAWVAWRALAVRPAIGRVALVWRRRSAFAFYACAAAAMAVLALGPVGRAFNVPFLHHAPYAWLMALPGAVTPRVPARAAMLVALALAQTAAFGFRHLTSAGRAPLATLLVASCVAIEGWAPGVRIVHVPAALNLPNGAIDDVRSTPVLELPMTGPGGDVAAMLRSMPDGHPRVNGFSRNEPPYYAALEAGMRGYDAGTFTSFQERGPLVVIVDAARDEGGAMASLVRDVPGARERPRSAVGPVFMLPAIAPASSAIAGSLIPIASVSASVNPDDAGAMLDGRIDTAWQTLDTQTPGDEVVVSFREPETLSRVEMDLGELTTEFPWKLQLSVDGEHGDRTVVWEGGTAGLAVGGALADRVRVPITIDLAHPARTQRLYLTLIDADFTDEWAIAELRVYAPAGAARMSTP